MRQIEHHGQIWIVPDEDPGVVDWVPAGAEPTRPQVPAPTQANGYLRRFRQAVLPVVQRHVELQRSRGLPGMSNPGDLVDAVNEALAAADQRRNLHEPRLLEGERIGLSRLETILAQPVPPESDGWEGVAMETVEGTAPEPEPEPEPQGAPEHMVTELTGEELADAFAAYRRSDPVAELLREGATGG